MVRLYTRDKFKDVFHLIRQLETTIGVCLYKEDRSEGRTWKEKLFVLTIPSHICFVILFAFSTPYVLNYSLISIIITGSTLALCCQNLLGTSLMYTKGDQSRALVNWCRSMYGIEQKYHPRIQVLADKHVRKCHKYAKLIIKVYRLFLYLDAFAITLGFAIVGIFLPESIYPKFSFPLPFLLPFKNQETYLCYCLTLLTQFKTTVDVASLGIFVYVMMYVLSIHHVIYLDIIKESVGVFQRDVERNYAEKGRDNDVTLDEWIKVITDMVCDVNEQIGMYQNVYSGLFFMLEMASFGSLFIFGLILLVVHQQLFFAIGITVVAASLFVQCFINEKYLEKFQQVSKALYEIPWYILTPKERKMILVAMFSADICPGLNVVGIHPLKLERFTKVLQAAYSNCLVLKDLIQK